MADAGLGDEGSKARGRSNTAPSAAGWPEPMAGREFLGAFGGDLGEVALVPAAGDVFMIRISGETVWGQECGGIPRTRCCEAGAFGTASCRAGTPAARIAKMPGGLTGRARPVMGLPGGRHGDPETGIPVPLVSLD